MNLCHRCEKPYNYLLGCDCDLKAQAKLKEEHARYRSALLEIQDRGLNYATQSTLDIVKKALVGSTEL